MKPDKIYERWIRTSTLLNMTRALLIRNGKTRYIDVLEVLVCRAHWILTVNMDWDLVLLMLANIEDTLQAILVREGLDYEIPPPLSS